MKQALSIKFRNWIGGWLYKAGKRVSVEPLELPGFSAKLQVVIPDLKPTELEVSAQDPYERDLLGRKDFGDSLARLTEYGAGTGVISVHGGWGSGKTTFLKMWMQDARNQGKVVAMVNAWDGDYRESPLEYIADQLAEELQRYVPRNVVSRMEKRISGCLAKMSQPIFQTLQAGTAASSASDGGASWIVIGALLDLIRTLHKLKRNTVTDVAKLEGLRRQLKQTATGLWNNQKHGSLTRLIIVIDELDRCRPDYAVRFMETIKHVFEVEHVTFVVAANVAELAHAINGLYGEAFDGKGYLERFFDLSLSLPEGTRKEFVKKVVQDANLSSQFGKDIPSDHIDGPLTAEEIVDYMLFHSTLSLREIHKTMKHIGIMLVFYREQLAQYALAAVTLATVRAVSRDSYLAFEEGKTASEAANLLCRDLGKGSIAENHILRFVGDMFYWCWQSREGEGKAGERVGSEAIDPTTNIVLPDFENEEATKHRRMARRHLVQCRVVRDIIELTLGLYKDNSTEEKDGD